MLKRLAEGNYRGGKWQLYTTRSSYYKQSSKSKERFEMAGDNWVLSPEFKSAPLLDKSTEICLCRGEVPNLESIEEYYFASFPYVFTMESVLLDEDNPRNSDWYMQLEVLRIDHSSISEVPIVPFSPTPVSNFGVVQESRKFPLRDKRKSPCYRDGFPKNASVVQAGTDLFMVFGGQVEDEIVNELSLISISKINQVTVAGIYSPAITGLLPSPRSKFSLCNTQNVVFMYGGEIDGVFLNDLWKFEISSIRSSEGEFAVLCTQVITCGAIPRCSALMTVVAKDVYLLAGKNGSGYYLPVSRVNLETFIWSNVTYMGPEVFSGEGEISILPSKDPLLMLVRLHEISYSSREKNQGEMWILDTSLSRSFLFENLTNSYCFIALPNDYYFSRMQFAYKMLFSAHYKCRRIAHTVPALHRLLGAALEAGLFSDVEIVYPREGTIKLLQSCLAVRGSEASYLLQVVQHPDLLPQHYSHSVLSAIIKYLYTDTLVIPQLPARSHKGIDLFTPSDFLEEMIQSASDLHMENLKNLCVISLTQGCSLENTKVNLYADYGRLANVPLEPDLEFARMSSTEEAFAYLLAPDYKLICSDGVVGAHKFVLFARSSLFRRVFAGGFDLDQEEFKLDFDSQTVKLAKTYMYTDHSAMNSSQLVDTMRIAVYLGIPDLFQHCQLLAAKEVNYANVMSTLDLALELNARELVQYCEDLYQNCHLGNMKEYQDFLAENVELGNHFAQFSAKWCPSKRKFEGLSDSGKEEAISAFLSTASGPVSPLPTSYFDPLPLFLHDVCEIQSSGKSNLCPAPPLRLSKQVSLEDEHWECSNRFVLSSSDSEEEEA